LALSIPDDLFAELVRHVLSNIKAATRPDQIRSLIQAVTAISQAAGHRLGKYVTTIIPEVLRFVEKSDGDDELKEACFQAFETLVIRCPSDSAAFVENVSSLSLKYIKHDPNYDAGDDDGDEEADEEDEEWRYSWTHEQR
jgi:cullin-associated NEDD8-dissociated protein 1